MNLLVRNTYDKIAVDTWIIYMIHDKIYINIDNQNGASGIYAINHVEIEIDHVWYQFKDKLEYIKENLCYAETGIKVCTY